MTSMKFPVLTMVCALLPVAVRAQEDAKKPATPPQPKHAQHDVLQTFVGTWDVTMRSEAIPGVAGMEKATESTGSEHCELLNNGLWLKSTTHATCDGKPFEGLWLVGYDPFAKNYVGLWVCSDEKEPGPMTMTGTLDEGKKTWIWSGKTPHGDMRSVVVASDPDSVVETCFLKGADGKEQKCMEITRKRTSRTPKPDAAEAAANKGAELKLPQQIAGMHEDIGSWDAIVRCTGVPGQSATEEKATERVSAVCGGKWLWTDFAGRFQGQPFEGHALTGWDNAQQKVVSVWIDSMSPLWCMTTGTASPTDKEIVLEGKCMDPTGQPMTVKQRLTRADASTRAVQMETNCSQGKSTMDITYRRKAN